jgi:hypothetical protein
LRYAAVALYRIAENDALRKPVNQATEHRNRFVWLNRREAVEWLAERGLRIAPGTLANLAAAKRGPDYGIFGNRAYYRSDTLRAWAETTLAGEVK